VLKEGCDELATGEDTDAIGGDGVFGIGLPCKIFGDERVKTFDNAEAFALVPGCVSVLNDVDKPADVVDLTLSDARLEPVYK